MTPELQRLHAMLSKLIGYVESGVHPGKTLINEARSLLPKKNS